MTHTRSEETYTWGKNIQYPIRKGILPAFPLNNSLHCSFLVVLTFFCAGNMSLVKYHVILVPEMFLFNTSQNKLLKENKNCLNEGSKDTSLLTHFSSASNVFS